MADTPLKRGLTGRWRAATRDRAAVGRAGWVASLVLVVLLGGALRFNGLDWDQPEGAAAPLQMHPDERFMSIVSDKIDWPDSVGEYFDTAHSPLNPYNAPDTPSFVYGTLPLFLGKAVSTIAGDDPAGTGDSYSTTVVWGRRVTALFDTATIALVFALGATLFGRRAGLAAALLYALAVLPTQIAHFWSADPYLVFCGVAALLAMVRFAGASGAVRPWLWGVTAGVCIALAMASKVNGGLLLPVYGVALLARVAVRDVPRLGLRWGQRTPPDGNVMTDFSVFCLSLAVGILVFRVAQPYAFAGPHAWDMGLSDQWWDDIARERDFQDGNVDYPPFVQFAGTTPVLRPVMQMVLWGLGPALGLTAWAAAVVATVLMFRRRDLRYVVPLAAIAAVMAFQGPRFVAFMRYFAPIYPALCVFAGWAAVELWRTARERRRPWRPLPAWVHRLRAPRWELSPRALRIGAGALVVALFGATTFWALAFQNIYRDENPRIAASRWIYDNVPAGSTITGEIWDDTIPYAIPGEPSGRYQIVETEPYQPDSVEKVTALVYGTRERPSKVGLDGADYVAITSHRVRDSVPRLEREYPATIGYYELLDSGELGFEKVASFDVRPSFLGIRIDDSSAEESFTVYDHPHVDIYRKTAAWDPERALALLLEAHPERAVNLLPKQGRTNGLQFTPDEAAVQQFGGTFADIFDGNGFASRVPWLWWVLWLQIAALATVPWVTWLFRVLPDRGYGLSKLAGIATVALVTWLIVSWGGPHFSARLVWAVFAGVAAAGLAGGYARRTSLRADAAAHWKSWIAVEAVFVAVFAFFLALRYGNPDLWHNLQGGEKPVELAYLTAVAKSSTLPPYDPWFSGGLMNYYYMGWFVVAVPLRALRLLPEVAFNLAIPTYAALAATVAFSTVHNLVALSASGGRRVSTAATRFPVRPAIGAGVFAAILLVFAANLDSLHQTIERLQAVNAWGGAWGTGDSAAWDVPVVGEVLRLGARMLGGAVGTLGGAWAWAFDGRTLPRFDWWRASRAHPPQFDITEFPYWTFVFGDLHPHMMGLPFFGLVIATGAAYVLSAVRGLRAQAWALAATLGVALGLVRTVHTWDFPTAVLLAGASIVAGQVLATGRWQNRWWDAVAHLALAAGVLVVAFAPYTAHFEVTEAGLVRARQTTAINQQIAHFGVFFAFGIAFIAIRTHEELRRRRFAPGNNVVLAAVAGWWEICALSVFVVGLVAFTWRFGLVTVALSAVALVFLANLLWLEYRVPAARRDVPRMIATALFVAAVGISAGVDVVNLKNDIVRMNTVFKFGLQAWQLFALASAYAAWYAGRFLWSVRGLDFASRPGRRPAAFACTALAAFLLASSAIYLWSGTPERQAARFAETPLTLNGLAYLEYGTFREDAGTPEPTDDETVALKDDAPLIWWLRENVEGSPVIAEAVGPLYHWTGRISVNTGLPAVVGWDWHEIAYRMAYTPLVQQRRLDTYLFFRDPDQATARAYIRKYNVSYIIIGTEERVFGTTEGLAKFAQMEGVEPVYESGPYAIYAVADWLRESPAEAPVTGTGTGPLAP